MTDEEYLFKQTSLERKRIGRGDYNKKRQGGKTVRFPSDNLTKKEREAMSGEVKTYNMEKPVKWEAFKQWPDDLKRVYLLGLRDKFNAYTKHVADMFGVDQGVVAHLQKQLDIGLPRGGQRPALKKEEWQDFLNRGCIRLELAEDEPIADPAFTEPTFTEPEEEGPKPEEPKAPDFNKALSLAMVLLALQGSGAKLTLEVTL